MAKSSGKDEGGAGTPPGGVNGDWWMQQSRLQAQLTQPQKQDLRELHDLLGASPTAEKPVTGTTIFAEVMRVARVELVKQGVLDPVPEKTALERFQEGKAARAAAAKAEAEAKAAAEAQAKPEPPAEGGNGAVLLPQLREGSKVLGKCQDPGECDECETPFPAGSRVAWEPAEVKGNKGRTWGPGCCPVAKGLLEKLAAG